MNLQEGENLAYTRDEEQEKKDISICIFGIYGSLGTLLYKRLFSFAFSSDPGVCLFADCWNYCMEAEKSGDAAGTRKDRIVCIIYCNSRNDDDFL